MAIDFPAKGAISPLTSAKAVASGLNLGRQSPNFLQVALSRTVVKNQPPDYLQSTQSIVGPVGPYKLQSAKLQRNQQGNLRSVITGVTRDNTGAALGNCRVMLFTTSDKMLVAEMVSDASGNFTFEVLPGGPYFYVCYLVGPPDKAGTSLNTNAPVIV